MNDLKNRLSSLAKYFGFPNRPTHLRAEISEDNLATKVLFARQFFSVLSVVSLHLLFFCLNIDLRLWTLFDLTLFLNVTFTFGLIFALCVLVYRATPLAVNFIVWFVLLGFFGVRSGIHARRKSRTGGKYSMNPFEHYMQDKKRTILSNSIGYLLWFTPSPSAFRLGERVQRKFRRRFALIVNALSILLPLLVLCSLYIGYSLLLVVLFIMFISVYFAASSLDTKSFNMLADVVTLRLEWRNALLEMEDEGKSAIMAISVLAVSFLSAASGNYRYDFLISREPVHLIAGENQQIELVWQIGVTSQGILLLSAEDQRQFFVPFSSMLNIGNK